MISPTKRQEVKRRRPSRWSRSLPSDSVECRIWRGMLARCENPKDTSFRFYGAKGISVCERWHDFEAFYADMGPRPEGLSLDRVDPTGNYEPDNCRWATMRQQQNNRTNNHVIEYDGRSQTLTEWARELGINPITLRGRIARGVPYSRALRPGLLYASDPANAPHGTRVRYERGGCRCDDCRGFNAARGRAYKASLRGRGQ